MQQSEPLGLVGGFLDAAGGGGPLPFGPILAAGLAQIGATEPTKRIITGAVIVIAVVLDTYRSQRASRRG